MQVKLRKEVCSAKLSAPACRNLSRIQVDRMCQELADRHTRLHVEAGPEVQASYGLERRAPASLSERIAAVDVYHVVTIGVERSYSKLIAEQSVVASREIEERADCRIRLTVIIAEVALVVAIGASQCASWPATASYWQTAC